MKAPDFSPESPNFRASDRAVMYRDGMRLYLYYFDDQINFDDAEHDWGLVSELTRGEKVTAVFYIGNSSVPNRRIRLLLNREGRKHFLAFAGVTSSKVAEFFGLITLALSKNFPGKIFHNPEKACQWLSRFDRQESTWSLFENLVSEYLASEVIHLENGFDILSHNEGGWYELRQVNPTTVFQLSDALVLKNCLNKISEKKGSPLRVLVRAHNIESATRDAQIELSHQECIEKLALLYSSQSEKFLASFFIKVFRPSFSVKTFSNRQQALSWLIGKKSLGKIKTSNKYSQDDINIFQDTLIEYAKSNYSKKIETDKINDIGLKAIANLVNSLGEELEATTVLKSELETERAFLTTIVENIPLSLFIKDVNDDFRVVLWNRTAEREMGRSKEEMIGKSAKDTLPPREAKISLDLDRAVVRSKKVVEDPYCEFNIPGRGIIPFNFKKIPINIGEADEFRYLLVLGEDLSEKIKTEKEKKSDEILMYASSRMTSLGEMAAGIAHEINNPLGIIQGRVELIQNLYDQNDLSNEKFKSYLHSISSSVERVALIIQGLRSFAKDSSAEKGDRVPVSSIVETVLGLCRERIQNHGIKLEVPPIDPFITVICRETEIAQIILNLLNNAHDAIAGLSKKWIRITIEENDGFIEISVIDSGPGIKPDIIEKIFHPFFTTKSVGHGTGLGLSISKGLAEAHGGTLRVNTESKNTCFVLRIPKEPS